MITSHRYTHFTSGNDPVDFDYLRSFHRHVSSGIIDRYYRARLHGFENIPPDGPVILACNHSGNAFPHDSFVLDQLLWRKGGLLEKAKFRPLYSPKLAVNWWMRPFGLDNWWRRFGGIDQTYLNFDRILARSGRVIYYPEGIPGIGKGFNRRYRLQPFQPSFIKLAARYHVPVIPVYGVNAEWINPANITFQWLNRIGNRLLGIPFIPLPMVLLALVFPFFFYFGFPSNMKFFVGKPLSVREWLLRQGAGNPEDPDRSSAEKTARALQRHMQAQLDRLVAVHGRKPYRIRSLISVFRKQTGKKWIYTPFGWPLLFTRHFREFYTAPNKSKKNRILHHWDLIGYYLPLGWFFLALFRKVRKPPFGYHGLCKKQRQLIEGRYIWSLAKDP